MSLIPGLSSTADILTKARKNGYAVPAFNVENFDALVGVLDGAKAANSPLIVQTTQPAAENLGVESLVSFVSIEGRKRELEVALHLDHGDNLEFIEYCLNAGYSSVMFDGSSRELAENIDMTCAVVHLANKSGASVEAALGDIGSDESPVIEISKLKLNAQPFIAQTGAHILAVAIGSVHGMRSREVELDFEVLESVSREVEVPLVLHGSSGVKIDSLVRSIKYGVAKVNLETELRVLFRKTLDETLSANPKEIKPRNIMRPVRQAIACKVSEYQNILGAGGKSFLRS